MQFIYTRKFLAGLLVVVLLGLGWVAAMQFFGPKPKEKAIQGPTFADHWARAAGAWESLSIGQRATFCDEWAWMTDREKAAMAVDLSVKVTQDRAGFQRVLVRYFEGACE